MDSFEINKIIAAVLLIALLVIGIGKISDIAFHVDKPERSAYKVDIHECLLCMLISPVYLHGKRYLKFSQFQLQVVQ